MRHSSVSVKAFDDGVLLEHPFFRLAFFYILCAPKLTTLFSLKDSFDFYSGDLFAAAYAISSSEGEESDGEYALNVVTETTSQRLGKFPRGRKKHRHVASC